MVEGRHLALAVLLGVGCAQPVGPTAAPPPTQPALQPLPAIVEAVPTSPRRLVTVDGSTTCSIDDYGKVICWGELMRTIGPCAGGPLALPALSNVVDIAGGERLCARRSDGSAACWSPSDPSRVEEVGAFRDPGRGPGNDGALTDDNGVWGCVAATGRIECWGPHPFGEESAGALDVDANAEVLELVTGSQHVCARVRTDPDDEHVVCWGDNAVGQLGVDPRCTSVLPREVPGIDDAVAIASGRAHTCVVRSDGRVSCFGESAELALGANREAGSVLVDPPGIVRATAVAAGSSHTCVIHDGGKVGCFGLGSSGQLGAGPAPTLASKKRTYISEAIRGIFPIMDGEDYAAPYADTIGVVSAVKGVANASALVLSDTASCAMTSRGVRCWGQSGLEAVPPRSASDSESEGDCPSPPHPRPSKMVRELAERVVAIPDTSGARDIAFLKYGGCVVRRDGTVACWGGASGTRRLRPVEGLSAIVDAISAEYELWFRDELGSIHQVSFYDAPAPTGEATSGPSTLAKVVAVEYSHSCALDRDGAVACDGPLRGLPPGPATGESDERTLVPGLEDIVDIAAGYGFSCAVRRSGKVVCWGEGGPQLGREEVPLFSKKPWIVRGA